MKAIGTYLLIKPYEEEVRNNGIIISGEELSGIRYKKGNIVSKGELINSVDEGQDIYYDKSGVNQIIVNEVLYHVIRERDVVVALSQH